MTTFDSFSSIVKYSCDQSTLSPMRRIWRGDGVAGLLLPLPDLRDEVLAAQVVARLSLCSCSWRSTTICVAMPAWSVPGTHSVLKPRMRW